MARDRNRNIHIKNLRYEQPKQEWDVKVDRGTPLGNPFYMKSERERDSVCDKYHILLLDQIKKCNQDILDELYGLRGIYSLFGELNLFCWCAPKRCHAETIIDALLYRNEFNI